MSVPLGQWLDLIDREYLSEFIGGGGAAVKFAVGDDANRGDAEAALARLAADRGLIYAPVDSVEVKLHMMQDIFFAVARRIDWLGDAQRFVENLFSTNANGWPTPGETVALQEIAAFNRVDPIIMRREFNTWLTAALMNDTGMAQDFRIALMQLCTQRLIPAGHQGETVAPILEWLRGELRLVGPLRSANLYTKITRHNARAMLRSMCRWVRLCGHKGMLLTIDIRSLTRPAAGGMDAIRYTAGAVMDAYEVLRQLVDDADLFEGFFLAVIADDAFIGGDRKRSIDAYTALKMRIWDDVRARAQDNPLAPMVIFAKQ